MNPRETQREKTPEAYGQRVLEILNDPGTPEEEKRTLMTVIDNIGGKALTAPTQPQAVEPRVEKEVAATQAGVAAQLPQGVEVKERREYPTEEEVVTAWNTITEDWLRLPETEQKAEKFRELFAEHLEKIGVDKNAIVASTRRGTMLVKGKYTQKEIAENEYLSIIFSPHGPGNLPKHYVIPAPSCVVMADGLYTCYRLKRPDNSLDPAGFEDRMTKVKELIMEKPGYMYSPLQKNIDDGGELSTNIQISMAKALGIMRKR